MQFETQLWADSGFAHFFLTHPSNGSKVREALAQLGITSASIAWIAWQHCIFPFPFCCFKFVSFVFFQIQHTAFSCSSLPRRHSQLCWSPLKAPATSGHTAAAYLDGTLLMPFSGLVWCCRMLAQPDYSWTWVDGFAWCARGDPGHLLPWLPWSSSAEAQAPAAVMQASVRWTSINQLTIMHVSRAELLRRCKLVQG